MSKVRSFCRLVPAVLGMSLVGVSAAGCGSHHDQSQPGAGEQSTTGSVGLALQVAPGVSIGQVTWAIENPTLFGVPALGSKPPLSGTVDVSQSSTLQFVVGGLPAVGVYTITLTAMTSTGLSCSGSAMFSITPNVTTPVTVDVVCTGGSPTVDAGNNGSAAVNGVVTVVANSCAAVTAVSAMPSSVDVGGAMSLQAQGVDSSGSSSDVDFSWAVTGGTGSGTFSNTSVASPTFTCTSAGPVTVTVTASAADGGATCANNTASVQLTCTPPCTGDLSNIGAGDFHISLALSTKQAGLVAIISQRSVCNNGVFWDLRMVDGTLEMETDDNGGNYTELLTTAPPVVNDGATHQVLIQRVSGTMSVSIDGTVNVSGASNASFGSLAAFQQGTDACTPDGTAVFDPTIGTIANVCVGP